jgi:hypothetical protein
MDIRSFVNRPKCEAMLQEEIEDMEKVERIVNKHICDKLSNHGFKDKYAYEENIDPIVEAIYKDLLKLSAETQRYIRWFTVERATREYRHQGEDWKESWGVKNIVDPLCLKVAIYYVSEELRDELPSDEEDSDEDSDDE